MPDHPPICPNCDYDLSGNTASWSSQCPVVGQCPECGIGFEWSYVHNILNQWDSRLDWYAEHATNWKQLFRRTPGTFFCLLTPWKLFRTLNHRRTICLKALLLWTLLSTLLIHLLVSPAGSFAIRYEGGWESGSDSTFGLLHNAGLNAVNSFVFPYAYFNDGMGVYATYPMFKFYEWDFYSALGLIGVGITLSWILLIGVSLKFQPRPDHSAKLIARIAILSLIPVVIHLQVVRLVFGYDMATGKLQENMWLLVFYLVSALIMIYWQQVIWVNAIHKVWNFKPSWPINLLGGFGSVITGIFFAMLVY